MISIFKLVENCMMKKKRKTLLDEVFKRAYWNIMTLSSVNLSKKKHKYFFDIIFSITFDMIVFGRRIDL
jgi:hypothetical protein